jgi:5-methyltetrahydropteroyltriglutamate--homocysteine methyltransferase
MQRSTTRMLSTHVGSLPRPRDLLATLLEKQGGNAVDEDALDVRVGEAVDEVVRLQRERGIDVVNDGEVGKTSFLAYVNDRLGGFEPIEDSAANPWGESREARDFPEFYDTDGATGAAAAMHLRAIGPVTYTGRDAVARDIAHLKEATKDAGAEEVFMTAISPTNVENWQTNAFYDTDEEFLHAIGEAMREEYLAIVDAGFLLQIDDPGLLTTYALRPDWSVQDTRAWARTRVDALNHALRGIPEDRIRFHTCYSINMGPRVHDMELRDIVDLILDINAGAYSFEAANPRHEHEWRVWEDAGLPDDKIIIPGVVSHSTVLVEHPDTVAERLVRFAGAVGRERVIAGADCGFASFAITDELDRRIVSAKLDALGEGTRRASAQLWG